MSKSLTDGFGRIATDLRVSVTDRCDLRCTYCMPEEGLSWTPPDEVLSFDEIERLVSVAMTLGVRTVRLTGGEPLMRARLPDLVRRLSGVGLDDLSMTTNGTTLARHAKALKTAGLCRVNVSLDSLERHRFTAMTRRDRIEQVLEGISVAAEVGLLPVKVNCVVLRGVNDDEVVAFAEFARSTGCQIRFIEYLPLDADHAWTSADVVPSSEVLASIAGVYQIVPDNSITGQPATVYRFADGAPGSVGVIASVTEPFCDSCDRIRLSADGQLRSCLFSSDETDLRSLLRVGATDEVITHAMLSTVAQKQKGHGIGTSLFIRPRRSMSMIGG